MISYVMSEGITRMMVMMVMMVMIVMRLGGSIGFHDMDMGWHGVIDLSVG